MSRIFLTKKREVVVPKERIELRLLIREKFRTQEIFAHKIGVVDSLVSKWVRGFRQIKWENRGKDVAKALGISKKELERLTK